MTLSRRKFVKAGIVAGVCAGIPLKSILADTVFHGQTFSGVSTSTTDNLQQLNYYNQSTFAPYVNTKFRVYVGESNIRGITLREVADYFSSNAIRAAASPGDECFSLLFTSPPGKPFQQNTYLMEHDALGTFYIFVVPVSAQGKKKQEFYEAVVYRRQQSVKWQETTNVTAAEPVADVTVQNNPRVYSGGPMIILPGSQDTKQVARPAVKVEAKSDVKEELDIYRFRPAEAPSAIAAEIANRPRPRKRKTPQLTLAQAPNVDGLKLGMTPAQVLALFPGSETDKEVRSDLSRPATRFGVSSLMIKPGKYPSAKKFREISQINFMLLDGRVSTLYVGYEKPVWAHVDEFVAEFNKERNLPAADHWEAYVGMDTQLKTLKAKEFEISLFAGGKNVNINYVQLRDLVALAKYNERRAKAKKS